LINDAEKYKAYLSDDAGRPSSQRLLCLKAYHHAVLFGLVAVLAAVAGKDPAAKICVELFYVLIGAAFVGKVAGRYMEKKDCKEKPDG
jgi:hypothetical protein